MNYGGTGPQVGSYGQLPGMAMGQPGQQMMQQQQQQQMQMGMQQQQQAGLPNQQRMMMQQGMRPHPVYSGMMPGGPQNMPMYPPSGDHRQLEIMKHWPPLWKSTIAQEKNPEKRKNLLKSYSQQWDVICRQNQMFPNGMGGQGMMPGGHPSQMNMYPPQPGAMPPGAMPGMMNPMMTQQQSKLMPGQQPGGPINMQMRMQGQMPSQAGPGSMQNMIPPSATPQPGSVQQIGSNMSVPSPSAALLGQSPQVINPATPQNPASVQPGSMDAANPASQQDPEYIKLLIEFKKHGDKLRMVGERCDRDKKPLPKAYDRLLEIVDDKRTVQKDLLIKLLRNIQHILETNSLIQPVIEVCKMFSSEEEVASPPKQEKEKKGLLNPFSVVSQHFIRVPDEILENLEQQDLEFEVKRKSSEVAEVPTKRARLDPELEDMKEMPRIEIDCMFGKNGRKWEMSEQATKELHSIPWKIDPDSVPPSYKCPDVTVCIDPQILIVPPLRVQIPVSYPEKNPVVQFDRSFPMSVQISAQLATLFERQLSKSETRSITAIFESYKIACEQMVRLGRSSHSLSLNEKQHRQKLVV